MGIALPLEPALAGIEAVWQAWFPALSLIGGALTNPVTLVLRW
jgi:hypothetical protein